MTQKKQSFLKRLVRIKHFLKKISYQPSYRLLSVKKIQTDEYIATIQLIGKRVIFDIRPEEILSDDNFTDKFSPRDIRALTYLGYLGINSPKYEILAQRLAENEQVLFAVHKKGTKNIDLKTAQELTADEELLKNFPQKDAHKIAYIAAKESTLHEKILKEKARQQEYE